MCLEDRFLYALYNQPGFVSINKIAADIAITENALLSIIHRIRTGYPDFLILDGDTNDRIQLSPNMELQKEVRLFLADGGFTAINEQELRDYYDAEMEQYTKLQRLKSTFQKYGWIKWAMGTFLTTAGSIAVSTLYKRYKNKRGYFRK